MDTGLIGDIEGGMVVYGVSRMLHIDRIDGT